MTLKRTLLRTALPCALFLISVLSAAAQPSARLTVVSGIVATPAGKPAVGVEVGLYLLKPDYEHVAASAGATTDASGTYTISLATPEHSTIQIVKASTNSGVGFEIAGFGKSVRVILRPRGDFKIHLRNLSDHGAPLAGVVVHPTWMRCSTESRRSGDILGDDEAPWSLAIAPEFRATTDANGDAVIHGFPLGVATGIATEESPYVQVGDANERDTSILGVAGAMTHTLAVCRTGAVSGRVVFAASGKPAADICVQAYEGDLAVEPTAYTDETGRYEIDGLTPNTHMVAPIAINEELDVDNPGPAKWAVRGKQVVVSAAQQNTGVDFLLERGGLVKGIVTDSSTGKPAPDEFIGARVGGSPLQTQMTDNSGHYAMRVPAGRAIIVPVESDSDIDEGARHPVMVPSNGTAIVDISVNGRDNFDFASGTVLDAHGRLVPNANVVALGGYGGGTRADARGHFTFAHQDMPEASELYALRGGELTPFGVPAFDNADPAHIVLKMQRGSLPILTGRVLTSEGQSMPGVEVTIVRTAGNSGTIYAQLITDKNGRYASPGLWSGFSYEADAEVGGYEQRIDGPPVTPISGKLLGPRNIVMVKLNSWVAGRVIDAAGNPVKGANISCGDETTTNAAGRFRVGGVAPGSVFLEVTTPRNGGAFAELMSGTSDGVIQLDAPQPRGKSNAQPTSLG